MGDVFGNAIGDRVGDVIGNDVGDGGIVGDDTGTSVSWLFAIEHECCGFPYPRSNGTIWS